MKPPLVLLALLLAAAAPRAVTAPRCPGADPAAMALLAAMADAPLRRSFEAAVTLRRGDTVRSMRLRHRVGPEAVSEALTFEKGREVQVLRASHPLRCEHPGQQLLRAAAAPEGGCGLGDHYRLALTEGGRVAGRRTVGLVLQPRDLFRHGYVFEVDRETSLPLKGTIVAAGGRALEQFRFARLQAGVEGSLEASRGRVHRAGHPHPSSPARGDPGAPPWRVGWTPAGFVATDAATSGARRTFTDGLAAFSVFIERLPGPLPAGEGVAREGSTVSYTRALRLGSLPVLVTVLGEVPVNTARMVADAVRPER